MRFYPAYLDLRERPCLVVGGGQVAERKTLALLEAGAEITVVSPALTAKLSDLSLSGKITWYKKEFEPHDLSDAFLVFAATDVQEVNCSVAAACGERRILVNVAVPPAESTFIVPSVVERGELLIAVSTSGASPALSKKIRRELEAAYGPEYGVFLERFDTLRRRVLEEIDDEAKRRRIFQTIVDSDVITLFRDGKTHDAEIRMAQIAGLPPPLTM